ncbi:hypothetical protein CANCADRAFT_64110 [Tortispora caseinolytica NRRL Y-17796]|uniref:DNA-binding protein REB1 n=1 Tax=Tortispora caseinolytica NRRL Y-17796 TaxID=767744 RepID=A0A1E4TMH5_9ASCO|nr:hypothetical protein CANCADRAFT_64110 [Tortispora caseinolytica NRRL Y-17796]
MSQSLKEKKSSGGGAKIDPPEEQIGAQALLELRTVPESDDSAKPTKKSKKKSSASNDADSVTSVKDAMSVRLLDEIQGNDPSNPSRLSYAGRFGEALENTSILEQDPASAHMLQNFTNDDGNSHLNHTGTKRKRDDENTTSSTKSNAPAPLDETVIRVQTTDGATEPWSTYLDSLPYSEYTDISSSMPLTEIDPRKSGHHATASSGAENLDPALGIAVNAVSEMTGNDPAVDPALANIGLTNAIRMSDEIPKPFMNILRTENPEHSATVLSRPSGRIVDSSNDGVNGSSTDNGTRNSSSNTSINDKKMRSGAFSQEEDMILHRFFKRYCEKHGLTKRDICERVWSVHRRTDSFWDDVSFCLPDRTRASIYKHVRRLYNTFEVRAKWSPKDDEELARLYALKGNQWKEIGATMGRMSEDCRDRWRNYVKCGQNRSQSKWSSEEELALLKAIGEIARASGADDVPMKTTDINWTVVSEQLGGLRSRIQCRYKWKKLMAQDEELVRAEELKGFGVVSDPSKIGRLHTSSGSTSHQQPTPTSGSTPWQDLDVLKSGM